MTKLRTSKSFLPFIGLLTALLTACILSSGFPHQESEPTPDMPTPPPQQNELLLPAPLFYLEDGQIWRLETDGKTQRQITQENAPIDAFDLSADAMLAYISNNRLIICDAQGQNKQVLRAGPTLAPIPDEFTRLNDPAHITSAIRSPYWSPNGRKIAFIENGLQVFDLTSNQAEMIWSQSTTSSEPIVFESVLGWSPDGQFIMVSQYAYPLEGEHQRWLSVLQLDGPLYSKISGRLGETFAWSPDSSELFLANAVVGSERSLMRCDPETMQCRMIAEFEPARWYYFYAHPYVRADGRLLVWMGASDNPEQPPFAFNLISLRQDGYERHQLRQDGYPIESALWSPDGRGVLITLSQAIGEYPVGSLLWVSTEDLPVVVVTLQTVTNLRWGSEN